MKKLHLQWLYIIVGSLTSILLIFMGRGSSVFADFYSQNIYPLMVNLIGRFSNIFPFSIFEFLIYVLFIMVGVFVILVITSIFSSKFRFRFFGFMKNSYKGLLCGLTTLLLLFTLGCGINYERNSFSEDANLLILPSSQHELVVLSQILTEELKVLSKEISVDNEGLLSLGENKKSVGKEAVRSMKELSKTNESLKGYTPDPKPILSSKAMSSLHLSGIFSPFTIEANYNRDIPDYLVPFTMGHELAHLKGYMPEEEAGFIGYLTCMASDVPEFRYSGALNGLIYALNALYAYGDQDTYAQVVSQLPEQVKLELQNNHEYWKAFEGKAAQVASKANDYYLKANAQEDGVRSYGKMVDLLIAHHRVEIMKITGQEEI